MSKSTESSPFKNFIKSSFNVKSWADWGRVNSTSNFFLLFLRNIFVIRAVDASEVKPFEQAISELGLTEIELQNQLRGLKRLCILMIMFAIGFYIYAMYELLYGGFLSVMVSLVMMFVSLALAFRYHFWVFQIRQRKLGCRFSEWFKATFTKVNQA